MEQNHRNYQMSDAILCAVDDCIKWEYENYLGHENSEHGKLKDIHRLSWRGLLKGNKIDVELIYKVIFRYSEQNAIPFEFINQVDSKAYNEAISIGAAQNRNNKNEMVQMTEHLSSCLVKFNSAKINFTEEKLMRKIVWNEETSFEK